MGALLLGKILITGGCGFLGRHCLLHFSQNGFEVHGIGRGHYGNETLPYSSWREAAITTQNLLEIGVGFEAIIHCAGGSSVAMSFDSPSIDYNNTVTTTSETLEYIRLYSPATKLVIPSSAAVYGESGTLRNSVSSPLNPSSPYGVHKKMAEDLCLAYQQFFNVDVSIIRFFSIYGPGLRKQLIWDACQKLYSAKGTVGFWGTGEETRDWLYVSDAVELIDAVISTRNPPKILNGGTGKGTTIQEVLYSLAELMGFSHELICFKGEKKTGDPSHYLADLRETKLLGWRSSIKLGDGLKRYLDWFKATRT
ncbi:MAG: NAD(P)-dependent oxidoreductase [Xanthomonadales bacterium]|nr:NAD(P)-dependent oxidoreductase [Xanthomonadales bacterium]